MILESKNLVRISSNMVNIDERMKELIRNSNTNVVVRKNRNNQTYIDCVMGLLRYFELGGFIIREDKHYGYLIYIEKKDRNAEYCNGEMISITDLGISIKRFKGQDKNSCNTFESWKLFCNYDFTPDRKNFLLKQMKYSIHTTIENNWPEIAQKKMAVADKKLSMENDFKK